jgi:hypothetical protein
LAQQIVAAMSRQPRAIARVEATIDRAHRPSTAPPPASPSWRRFGRGGRPPVAAQLSTDVEDPQLLLRVFNGDVLRRCGGWLEYRHHRTPGYPHWRSGQPRGVRTLRWPEPRTLLRQWAGCAWSRWMAMVARAGFEPAISGLKGRRPSPLDERASSPLQLIHRQRQSSDAGAWQSPCTGSAWARRAQQAIRGRPRHGRFPSTTHGHPATTHWRGVETAPPDPAPLTSQASRPASSSSPASRSRSSPTRQRAWLPPGSLRTSSTVSIRSATARTWLTTATS